MADNDLNINFGQPGIADYPHYAVFTTVTLKGDKKAAYKQWLKTAKATDRLCAKDKYQTVCVRGVDFALWSQWCKANGMPLPKGLTGHEKLTRAPFKRSPGDLWFHIKGDSERACQKILDAIKAELAPIAKNVDATPASKMHGGKVFGGRFIDGMINPVDRVNLSTRIIVGEEDPPNRGAAYVLQQKFQHNWDRLNDMNAIEKEDMIGRNENDAIIPEQDDRSHIKCVRRQNGERMTLDILRQALPYGHSPTAKGNEEGVYFVAYGKSGDIFNDLIDGICGPDEGYIRDKMLNNTRSILGNYWFIPSAKEAGLAGPKGEVAVPVNEYFEVRSKNGLMFYNNRDYLNQLRAGREDLEISDRIVALLGETFDTWNDTWQKAVVMPPLGHLQQYLAEPRWKGFKWVAKASTALRKGLATKISLSDVLLREPFREQANLFNIKPKEIIVGNMPPFTLGSGTQVMEYLSQDEKIGFFVSGMLNEYSSTGHNVPNYKKALRIGIKGLLDEANGKLKKATDDNRDFYQSVVWAVEGLQEFVLQYSRLASRLHDETPEADIAKRMKKLATGKPEGLLESAQLIFIVNCALHQLGEPMSIGRLDQYLIEAYEADIKAKRLTQAGAQEIIDAFWLKMDETVLYNRQHMQDYLTYGTGAVFYANSPYGFPQGSALNQWVQQVTVGGYLPTDDKVPQDACNAVTLMCLRASRRLPLNAPCLSLRVHGKMDKPIHKQIVEEAAKAILSGGAHPILINDDKLSEGLRKSGPMSLADSRDYTCDGCFEPIIGGKTEWAFSYVPILPVVGMAMNQGATIEGAGWVNLRGLKQGWNSPPPEHIRSFEQFMDIFYTQYTWQISGFYNALMNNYGALGSVCPSPLFSSMVDGCMESGRDMTDGGAEYHIVAPMMCGITNAINALYAIKKMVYDPETAVTTLPVLLQALWNNWGETMQEPFQNTLAGPARAEDVAAQYKALRQVALSLPKFGRGDSPELKAFGAEVVGRCVQIIRDGIDKPLPGIAKGYEALKKKYGIKGRPFAFVVAPGVGTFEDNLGLGAGMGASADGRLSGETIADDFSAAPSPCDQPPGAEPADIFKALKDWNVPAINIGLSNAAPVDVNVREDFPLDTLKEVIRQFAAGKIGSNLLTVTTADPETYAQAQTLPEKYDLVRVRQGGWSEFYMAMFPQHQQYIIRRPYYGPSKNR
ncbi:MAG: Dyp-type peroxidase [Betaproteobacteria bacterium]|nr:Dyp-type peroxidase [Betaproteobacteria bacterium]